MPPDGAQGPVEDPEAEAPGLRASFSAAADPSASARAVRVDPDLAWDWGDGAPDARVPADGFVARWAGLLLVQAPGIYRFSARTDGSVRVTVADRIVLEGDGDAARSTPVDLPADFASITVDYRHDRGPARLAIDWEGPGFGREPVPARLLFRGPADAGAAAPDDRFEEGRRLADRLGCANCHRLLDLPRHPELGPPLADAGRAIEPGWLAAWLADPTAVRSTARMPAVGHGLPPEEVGHLAAYLRQVASKPRPPNAEAMMAMNVADPRKGRLLFQSVGCLGCHTRGGSLAASPDRAAPDLTDLGRKRTTTWLASYLARTKTSPAAHRPDMRLDAEEAAHLAAYLVEDPPPPLPPPPPAIAGGAAGDPARGRALADRHRCASCHAIPGLSAREADLHLDADSSAEAGCLANEPIAGVPRFALEGDRRGALRAFVEALPRSPSPTAPRTLAEDAIRRLQCLGCHARDGRGGAWLGTQVAEALAKDPALGTLKGTLTPPDLSAVGDKLRPEYLAEAVRGGAPTARPWLSVRMPTFAYAKGEAEAIVASLRGHDRPREEPDPPISVNRPDARTVEAATTLIGQRGFGCVSCHVLAGKIPPGGEPETLGPDLALAHRRMPERYFHRWIANPQRIIPGTPMPQFLQPVATAPGSLDDQLATVWQLLGSDRVAEAASFGTREILKPEGDRALVVRDMVLLPDAPGGPYIPRGLAIGFRNGQSLLFDTDRLAWVAWWRHGFLSRTKSGRLWEWHPEGRPIWVAPGRGSPVAFVGPDGAIVAPGEVRERFGTFSELTFEGRGVTLAYVLNGPGGKPVPVEERLMPTEDGWERRVRVRDLPNDFRAALAVDPPPMSRPLDAGAGYRWSVGGASMTLRVIEPSPPDGTRPAPIGITSPSRWILMTAPGEARVRLDVE